MNLEKLKGVLYTLDKISINGINNVNMMSGCMQVLQDVINDIAKDITLDPEELQPENSDTAK